MIFDEIYNRNDPYQYYLRLQRYNCINRVPSEEIIERDRLWLTSRRMATLGWLTQPLAG